MSNVWKLVLLVVAGLALVGAAAGMVAAQDNGDATPTEDATPSDIQKDREAAVDAYLEKLAGNLGVSVEELTGALQQTALDIVDEKVADGTLTEEQAAEIRERIESGEAPLFGPFGRGFKFGVGVGIGLGANLDELAEFLGVEIADIHAGLQDGQSLAQIADANGVSADDLSAFLLSNLEEKLNEAVANERITQERADEILANAPEKIDRLINHEGPLRPHSGPRPFDRVFERPLDGDAVPETSGLIF